MKIAIQKTSLGPIEYSLYGTGIPILFLHGGHANARERLTHTYLDLTQFTLITPSRPGYGNTPLGNNTTPLTAAKQIAEMMEALGFHNFHVIGISAGGLTAIAMAALYPKRVTKLVLASAVSHRWLSPEEELYKRGKKLFNPRIERYTWALLKFFLKAFPRLIISKMMTELTSVQQVDIGKEEIEGMKKMLLVSRSRSGFVTDLDHELPDEIISQVTSPTLIIHSKNDGAVPATHPVFAKKHIANSTLVWVENEYGHLIWLGNKSQEIIGRISAFILD